MPVDHLLEAPADALPAIVVVRLPNGFTHFVVVWRRHGPLVQVMDPAVGQRWMRAERLLADAFVHEPALPAGAWRHVAGSDGFLAVLRAGDEARRRPRARRRRGGRPGLAAAGRAGRRRALVTAGGLRPGRDAAGVLGGLLALAAVAAAGVVAEAVAFRAVFDLSRAAAPRAGLVRAVRPRGVSVIRPSRTSHSQSLRADSYSLPTA